MSNSPLGRLRTIGFLEGSSFLILLGIAMPLKKFAGISEAVTIVGWIHGLLFMLFVAAAFQVYAVRKWPIRRLIGALAASVIPFGPFVLDGWLRREEQEIGSQNVSSGTDRGRLANPNGSNPKNSSP